MRHEVRGAVVGHGGVLGAVVRAEPRARRRGSPGTPGIRARRGSPGTPGGVLWQLNLPDRFDIYSLGLIFLQMVSDYRE